MGHNLGMLHNTALEKYEIVGEKFLSFSTESKFHFHGKQRSPITYS